MQNIEELYILGRPIDTRLGALRFITVGEYDEFSRCTALLTTIDKSVMIKDISSQKEGLNAEFLYNYDFVELLKEFKDLYPLYDMYRELFIFMYREDVFDEVKDEAELMEITALMRKMNKLELNIENENSEIAYFDKLKKAREESKSPPISFEIMYSLVAMFYNIDVDKISIYKMNVYFQRIAFRFTHNQSVLYSSVDSDYKITPWYAIPEEVKPYTMEDANEFATSVMN